MLVDPTPSSPVMFGEYELVRRIGAGGMGEVFLARHSTVNGRRACVVKKVLPNLVENRAFVGRFRDESRVVVKLQHPNIARVYAMGDYSGEYYLTMEYVQGKTVSRFAKRLRERKQQMPLGLILLVGEKVCEGLEYAHEAQDDNGQPLLLVHRDLSPANVCISYRGEVKIIDFGAAQSTLKEEQTAPRIVIGNLTYMAPEQARKQPVDGRADVYSCAVMLWELLAWHALPQKGDPVERWRRAASPTWEAPSMYNNALHPDVDATIMRALGRHPDDRFGSAQAFGEALRKLRVRYSPQSDERQLGELLSRVFKEEKDVEDAVLRQLDGAIVPGPTEKQKQLIVVPPNALAFEHTAVLAPDNDELLAVEEEVRVSEETTARGSLKRARRDDDSTPTIQDDPRLPLLKPTGVKRPARVAVPLEPPPLLKLKGKINPARVSFGVQFTQEPSHEPSLVEEIEASESETHEESARDAKAKRKARRKIRFMVIAGTVFVGATGLGFLAIWLWLLNQ
ncbi:MAG: serine/threonine protein kinase [Myxococcaceae bacterium]|nr:serine/threonine protein kinase [Myxococcaceae bacterium]